MHMHMHRKRAHWGQTRVGMLLLNEIGDGCNVARAARVVQRHTALGERVGRCLDRGVHVQMSVCCCQLPQPIDVAAVCQHQRPHCCRILVHSPNTVTRSQLAFFLSLQAPNVPHARTPVASSMLLPCAPAPLHLRAHLCHTRARAVVQCLQLDLRGFSPEFLGE